VLQCQMLRLTGNQSNRTVLKPKKVDKLFSYDVKIKTMQRNSANWYLGFG